MSRATCSKRGSRAARWRAPRRRSPSAAVLPESRTPANGSARCAETGRWPGGPTEGDGGDAARQQHRHLATQPAHATLRAFIAAHASAVSAVTYVEVLGF